MQHIDFVAADSDCNSQFMQVHCRCRLVDAVVVKPAKCNSRPLSRLVGSLFMIEISNAYAYRVRPPQFHRRQIVFATFSIWIYL